MRDLQKSTVSSIGDAAYNMIGKELDLDTLRDEFDAYELAESVCTYYSQAMDIISQYESEFSNDIEDLGATFKAEDWQQAMSAYANQIAAAAINSYANEAFDNIEECAEALSETLIKMHPEATLNEPIVTLDCPYGWAPHDLETPEGVCVWSPRNLEGSHAIAINAGAFWLSYSWS